MCVASTEKQVKDDACVEHSNCKTLVEDFSSNYQFLTPVLKTFTIDTEEYPLGISYNVNDDKINKNLYHRCSFIWRFKIENDQFHLERLNISKSDESI